MDMDNTELRKLLEQLHEEIEHAGSVDEGNRELMQQLWEDIHELLKRTEATPARSSAVRRLEQGIEQLETDHPSLTALLTQLLETLSNAGI